MFIERGINALMIALEITHGHLNLPLEFLMRTTK
jgi:hypothetical protein